MVIRNAIRSDGVALDALLTKLIRDETQYDSNLSPEDVIKDNYAERIEEGSGAFVAEEDGNIVGYLYGFLYQIPGMMLRPVLLWMPFMWRRHTEGRELQRSYFGVSGNLQKTAMLTGLSSRSCPVMRRPSPYMRNWDFMRRKSIWNCR